MGRDRFGYPAWPACFLTGILHGGLADVSAGKVAREKPLLWLFHAPPVSEDFQQLRREHHIAIFLALALVDANDHPFAVDVGWYQAYGLRDSQPGRVAGGKDRVMLEALHAAEKLQDFFGAENDGQLLRLLGRRDNFFECPVLVQRYFIQKTKRSHSGQYGTGRQLLFVSQIQTGKSGYPQEIRFPATYRND